MIDRQFESETRMVRRRNAASKDPVEWSYHSSIYWRSTIPFDHFIADERDALGFPWDDPQAYPRNDP